MRNARKFSPEGEYAHEGAQKIKKNNSLCRIWGDRTVAQQPDNQITQENSARNALVFQFNPCRELEYEPYNQAVRAVPVRDLVCGLCEKTVAVALDIPLSRMRSQTRSSADAALARQIAMYLCHTTFSILLTEIGLHFRRDRTTVSYACALIEDRRDDLEFDALICELEALLLDARRVMNLCIDGPDEPLNTTAKSAPSEVQSPDCERLLLTTRGSR